MANSRGSLLGTYETGFPKKSHKHNRTTRGDTADNLREGWTSLQVPDAERHGHPTDQRTSPRFGGIALVTGPPRLDPGLWIEGS